MSDCVYPKPSAVYSVEYDLDHDCITGVTGFTEAAMCEFVITVEMQSG